MSKGGTFELGKVGGVRVGQVYQTNRVQFCDNKIHSVLYGDNYLTHIVDN